MSEVGRCSLNLHSTVVWLSLCCCISCLHDHTTSGHTIKITFMTKGKRTQTNSIVYIIVLLFVITTSALMFKLLIVIKKK